MPAVRIGPKHQVTIPKGIFANLELEVGDSLEATAQGGRIVLTPLQVSAKAPAPRLTPSEQRSLARAKAKVDRIRRDLGRARGLTAAEVRVAVKVGLIDSAQAYWWAETWQRREREAEADLDRGNGLGPFKSVADFKAARRQVHVPRT